MGKWLFLIFVVLPIAEIWLLVVIGREIGFWATVGFLVGVGVVGSMLAKAEGARVLRDVARAREEGRVPEEGLLSAALVLVAGVLLVIPGVITDVIGLVLLFPPTRRLFVRVVRRWFEARVAAGSIHVVGFGGGPFGGGGAVDPMDRPIDEDDDVIDVEAEPEPRERAGLPDPKSKGPDERE